MTAAQPEIGFSNSAAAKDAPQDVYPDVATPEAQDPGFTNAKVVKGDTVEDKSVASKRTKKK